MQPGMQIMEAVGVGFPAHAAAFGVDVQVVELMLTIGGGDVRIAALRGLCRHWNDVAALAADPAPAVRASVRDAFAHRTREIPLETLASWIGEGQLAGSTLIERLGRGRQLRDRPELLEHFRRRLPVVEAQLDAAGIELDTDDCDYDCDNSMEALHYEREDLMLLSAVAEPPILRRGVRGWRKRRR